MRALVRLDDATRAETLGDALFAEGIESRVEESREGGFIVWVEDELHMDAAKRLLAVFEATPDDPRFERARNVAAARRREKQAAAKKSRHRTVDVRKRWQTQSGWGRLTLGLIIASVAVTVLAGTLLSAENTNEGIKRLVQWDWAGILRRYEAWRIITPIFLHFGPIHLMFNMWWLKDLGAFVEHRHGTFTLALMVLVTGALSNFAQAYIGFFTNFGGMSGVVYGLFGYLWLRGHLDPTWGFRISRSTVIILLAWMAIGFAGLFSMANWAHLGGLVVGMVWGFLASGWIKRRMR
jgi:GlpG protein